MAVSIPSTESLRWDDDLCVQCKATHQTPKIVINISMWRWRRRANIAFISNSTKCQRLDGNQIGEILKLISGSNEKHISILFVNWVLWIDVFIGSRYFIFLLFFFNFLSVFPFCYSPLLYVCMFAFTFERSVSLIDTLIFEYRPSVFLLCSLGCVHSLHSFSLSLSIRLCSSTHKAIKDAFYGLNNWFPNETHDYRYSKWCRSKYIKLGTILSHFLASNESNI